MKTYSRDLLSSFRRSRALGIKRLWVARLVRPPGDSWDCSSVMWQDIWTHCTDTAGDKEHCWSNQGNSRVPTRTGHGSRHWRRHSLSTADQPPRSRGSLNLKMREPYKSIPKETHKFLKDRSTLSVFEVASEVHSSGTSLTLSRTDPTGTVHTFTKYKS